MQGITNAVTSSENSELYYTKSETNALLNAKASTALDNLSSAGQMIIDSANGTISNCILEIPQNIKLTLENRVLTLNSGSVLTDSGATYQTITINVDRTLSLNDNGTFMIFSTTTGILTREPLTKCVSGTTDSLAGIAWHIWFDITNKEVFEYGSDGTTAGHRTYPLCIVKIVNGVASFAKDSDGNDMIFNGAGFIGHHAFVYPNVKELIPNGFNDDRSLKSTLYISDSLIIEEIIVNPFNALMLGNGTIYRRKNLGKFKSLADLPQNVTQHDLAYIINDNIIARYDGTKWVKENRYVVFVEYSYNGTTVTDFTIRQPYEGARNLLTDDLYKQIGDVETLLAAI